MRVDVIIENYQKQHQKKLLKYRIFQEMSLIKPKICKIARLRRIKNRDKLTKEDLIITLLKSASSAAECNFEKLSNNNTDDDDTYDGKIRGKISDISMILSRLGNMVDINARKKLKGCFMK